jgi:hypothetical protein
MKNLKIYKIIFALIFYLFIVDISNSRAEWTEPTGNPPENNVMAPLNQGTTPQFKNSGLHIGDNTTMGDYMFSVSNGASYFGDLLEVGEKVIITADSGNFETEGNIILQGTNLIINDSGVLYMERPSSQLKLNSGDTNDGFIIGIITGAAGTVIKVRDDNNDPSSVAISAGIPKGTAIYGNSGEGIGVRGNADDSGGIGVLGSADHSNAIAGRFDGLVRFNPPPADNISIEVNGKINMLSHNIINLASPSNEGDAVNKEYVDNQIGGSTFWDSSDNNIYNNNSGRVGIGTDDPGSDLHIYSTGTEAGQTRINLEYDYTGTLVNNLKKSDWFLEASSYGGSLNILNSTSDFQPSEKRLTINSDGRVGIGTGEISNSSPNLKLNVDGNIGATEYCDENGENCVAAGAIGSDNLGNHIATQDLLMNINDLRFYSEAYIKSGIPQGSLEISSNNGPIQVGIGTVSPSATLEVAGGMEVSDVINATDLNINNIILNHDIDVAGSVKTDIITGYNSSSSQIEFDSSGNIIITIP